MMIWRNCSGVAKRFWVMICAVNSGVGDVQLFGSPYAMRIWLDPQKLAGYSLSASEAMTSRKPAVPSVT
jgi:hypothetical protein